MNFSIDLFGPHLTADQLEKETLTKNAEVIEKHGLKHVYLFAAFWVKYSNLFADYDYLKEQIKKYEESNNKH